MCAERATKGLIKTGEVVTEMCTKGFLFLIHFCQSQCECLYVHAAVHVFNFHAGGLTLLFDDTQAQTDTHYVGIISY